MPTTPSTATERLSRQMQAAMHLKRRYETLFDKPISITRLRKDPELLDAVRIEVARSGDRELLHLLEVAFDDDLPESVDLISLPGVPPLPRRPAAESSPPSRATAFADQVADRRRWWPIAAAAVALVLVSLAGLQYLRRPAPAPAKGPSVAVVEPRVVLRLQGSNTIGEKLAPMLVQGYFAREGNVDVQVREGANPVERKVLARDAKNGNALAIEVKAHGSATAFTGLETATADVGMSSRPINTGEIERLTPKFGDLTQPAAEHVVGLDGIAVVVNPGNPVVGLTVEQVARIFSGEITNRQQLGGPTRPIQIYARDEKSGTWDSFKSLVLDRYKLTLAAAARRLESSSELSDTVAQEAGAIGFIGLPYVRSARALEIADAAGSQALLPTPFTVATEDYPLSRRLFLYVPQSTTGAQTALTAARFVEFALSPAGQDLVQQAGFVPQRAAPERVTPPTAAPEAYRRIAAQGQRLSLTFRFRLGSDQLDNKARRDLERVLAYLQSAPSMRFVLMGFADSTGGAASNLQLSRERAQSIAAALAARGVAVADVIGFGSALPLATNDTQQGRQRNRRVEIWAIS